MCPAVKHVCEESDYICCRAPTVKKSPRDQQRCRERASRASNPWYRRRNGEIISTAQRRSAHRLPCRAQHKLREQKVGYNRTQRRACRALQHVLCSTYLEASASSFAAVFRPSLPLATSMMLYPRPANWVNGDDDSANKISRFFFNFNFNESVPTARICENTPGTYIQVTSRVHFPSRHQATATELSRHS